MSDHHFWVVVRDAQDRLTTSEFATDVHQSVWLHADGNSLGPDDVSVAEMDTLRRAVWQWIISSNEGAGVDVEDLMSVLDRLGFPCPDDMDGED